MDAAVAPQFSGHCGEDVAKATTTTPRNETAAAPDQERRPRPRARAACGVLAAAAVTYVLAAAAVTYVLAAAAGPSGRQRQRQGGKSGRGVRAQTATAATSRTTAMRTRRRAPTSGVVRQLRGWKRLGWGGRWLRQWLADGPRKEATAAADWLVPSLLGGGPGGGGRTTQRPPPHRCDTQRWEILALHDPPPHAAGISALSGTHALSSVPFSTLHTGGREGGADEEV